MPDTLPSYAMSGTELRMMLPGDPRHQFQRGTRGKPHDIRPTRTDVIGSSIRLRDVGYGPIICPTRCPVLTWRMLLPGPDAVLFGNVGSWDLNGYYFFPMCYSSATCCPVLTYKTVPCYVSPTRMLSDVLRQRIALRSCSAMSGTDLRCTATRTLVVTVKQATVREAGLPIAFRYRPTRLVCDARYGPSGRD
eukprot:469359-Rhodomonas_salina.4